MPDAWSMLPSSAHLVFAAPDRSCPCAERGVDRGADRRRRAERLAALDRALARGLVTVADAAERRAHLLAR